MADRLHSFVSSQHKDGVMPENREPATARRSRILSSLWMVAGALVFWRSGYAVIWGSDLWWHIATGRWIFEHKVLPVTDPWSFPVASSQWVVDSWLSDLTLYLWTEAFGLQSLAWWKWMVLIATFLILMKLLQRLGKDDLTAWFGAFAASATAAVFLDVRPQIYSLLCYVILLQISLDRKRISWWLLPLFLVWVNLHAGFTLGLITLPILVLPYVLQSRQRRRTLIITCSCVAVCFVNPNGYHAFTQPLIYALQAYSPFHSIAEWLPPFEAGGIHSPFYPYLTGLFVLSFLAQWIRGRRPGPHSWVLFALGALTLAMSLKSRRFIPVFAISQSLLFAVSFAPFVRRISGRLPVFASPLAALMLGLVLLWPYPQRSYAFDYLTARHSFPVETLNFIETNALTGNLFSYWNWGGYIHLRTFGEMKVFADGRASSVYSEETYLRYLQVLYARERWIDIVENSGADYFLWPASSEQQIAKLRKTGRWQVLFRDSISILLIREGRSQPEVLRPTPESAYKDLARGSHALAQGAYTTAELYFHSALKQLPYEENACLSLARVQVMSGKVEEGRKTMQLCQKIFPQPVKQRFFDQFVLTTQADKEK